MKVKIGICTDVHTDLVHDGPRRVRAFMQACEREAVDFCVDLGDFCSPGQRNWELKQEVLGMLEGFPIPWYHVLGNHDKNFDNTQGAVAYLGMPGNYYSFDFGGIHFVVLDTCYYQIGDRFFAFDCGDYLKKPEGARLPVIPPEELAWLEKDLAQTSYPSVLFSHYSLIQSRNTIVNADELEQIIRHAPNGVVLSVSGHEHRDWVKQQNGIWYTGINSMTYYWAGHDYEHTTYGEELERQYPFLKKMFPYEEPLFAFLEIDHDGAHIMGNCSRIVGQQPAEIHYERTGLMDDISAEITEKFLRFEQDFGKEKP